MKDIADRLGISTSTVYKAFNGASDISDETRTAIMEMAAEMGYSGRKRTTNSKKVCVFIYHMEAKYTTYYFYEVMIAFMQVAAQHGYDIMIRGLSEDDTAGYNQIMNQYGFEGCLILGLDTRTKFYTQLSGLAYPAVVVDNRVEGKDISCVLVDNFNGMSLIVNHLVELGHKRIALINGEKASNTSRERFAAYLNTLTVCGLQFKPELVRYGDFSESAGAELAEELVRENKDI
jgi:DNA-binding LacI/PurR family transcriptional regulator